MTVLEPELAEPQTEQKLLHIVCCQLEGSLGVHRAFCGEVVLSDQANNDGGASCSDCLFQCKFGDCPEGYDCEVVDEC